MTKVEIRPHGGAEGAGGEAIAVHAAAVRARAQTDAAAAYASLGPRLADLSLSLLTRGKLQALARSGSATSLAFSAGAAQARLEGGAGGRTRIALKQRFLASEEPPDRFLIVAASGAQGFATLLSASDARLRWAFDEGEFGLTPARRGALELDGPLADAELEIFDADLFARASAGLRDATELLHLALDVGALEGFLAKAKAYLLNQARPWDSTGLARATDDPHIVRQWGEASARFAALAQLYQEASDEARRPPEARGSALAIARNYASTLATPLVNGLIEILGASSTSDRHGFDVAWRDLAAHALDARPVVDLETLGRGVGAPPPAGAAEPRSVGTAPQAQRLVSAEQALHAARELAASWSKSAAALDAERRVPRDELRELEQSGLLAITIPREHGGPALGSAVLTRVFRILATTDVALAQIPQNHFDFVDTLTAAEPETQRFFYGEVLRGARFGNAIAERGLRSRRDLATTIVEDGDGYLIDGVKAFCTGALTAAWVPVHARHADGRILTAYVERHAPGLDVRQDWDAYGQRATFSGTTVLTRVFVARERVVDRARGHREFGLAQFAGNQLIHAAIEVGAIEGALDRAAEIVASGGASPAARDGERLGVWRVQAEAARALVDRAAALVDEAVAAREPSRELAIAALIAVDEAKSLAYAFGPAAAGDLIFLRDAPQARAGLDRLWRNSRTHALHDPVRWRQFYVGAYRLNGELAPDIARRYEATSDAT